MLGHYLLPRYHVYVHHCIMVSDVTLISRKDLYDILCRCTLSLKTSLNYRDMTTGIVT